MAAHSRSLVAAAIGVLWCGPALADISDTPACRRDLAEANRLIAAIRARDNSFVPGDDATNCRLIRLNFADMVEARGPMARCLKGHELGETIGQMDASIADIRAVIQRKCAGH